MESSSLVTSRYRFGPFILDVAEGSLTRNGYRVKLQDLPFRLLVMLVERSGVVLTKEEMRQHLWPKDTFVEFDNSLGVAVRKVRDALEDDTDSPRYLETVPRRGYRFLAPVAVVEAPRRAAVGPPHPPQPILAQSNPPESRAATHEASPLPLTLSPRQLKSWQRYLALTCIILLASGGAIYTFRAVSPPSVSHAHAGTLSAVQVRRSVAVLGFRNLPANPEDNWLSPAFAEMLTTELASDGAIRLVPGEEVARVKRELPVTDEDSLGKETLARIKTNPGADLVILGSYTPVSSQKEKRIRLDVRIQDTARGETIAERSFTGKQSELFELVTEAGAAIRQTLGVPAESGEVTAQARAALPSNEQAIRLYVDGKERLWTFDSTLARDLLVKAVAADPAFPLAHAALSEAWSHLGYRQKALAEAERARALSAQLGSEERLLIDAQYYSTLANHEKTIATYKELFRQFPDSLDYGLRLADEQRWINFDDAMRTLTALRHLPSASANDPRIDLVESRTLMTRDVAKAQAAALRGLERARAQGSPLLMSRAYGILCQTQYGKLPPEELINDCNNARESAQAAGEIDAFARNSNDLAGIYYLEGRVEQAEQTYKEALNIFRRTGDIEGISTVENNLGAIELLKGNGAEASRAFLNTIPGYREEGDKDGIALALNNLGDAARMSGDWKNALSNYSQAESVAKEIDDKSALGYIYTGIGDVQISRADLKSSESSYAQALNLRKQAGEKQLAAETEVRRALLLIEQGKAAEAESVLQGCKKQFHDNQQADDELESRIALITAFVDESRLAEASREVEQSTQLASITMSEELRAQMKIAAARVEAATGHLDSARAHLDEAMQRAVLHHLPGIELDARLRLADLKEKSGRAASARTDLLALESTAHSHGFELIAGKAHGLLAKNR